MSNDKWNDIWKIMKSGRLEFVDKCINDISCIICKEVLINAYSGPCGCRYCLECITNYLVGEEKNCPGDTNDCKDELISIFKNLSIDQPMNRKLSKLIVKCPDKNCDFKDEIRNIENHMRICDSLSFECPYMAMGCKECNLVNTDVRKHMLTEIVSHTKLLFEYIDDLKNELKILKKDKVELEKNYKNIKKCLNDFQLKYKNEHEEINVKIQVIENKYVEEQKSINDSKLQYEYEKREMKEKIKQIENKLTEEKSIDDFKLKRDNEKRELEEKIKEIEKKCNKGKRESATKIGGINKIITDLKSISKENDTAISNVMNEIRVLQKNKEGNYREFVWRINKWKEKSKDSCIVSKPFFSHTNGYKMSLWVWPNGFGNGVGTHLSVECLVMKGEYDDILPWPFKHGVTFELINQKTTQTHTISTIRHEDQYDLVASGMDYDRGNQKPKTNDSRWICYNHKFVSLKELLNDNQSLTINDQIFIRCRVIINQ